MSYPGPNLPQRPWQPRFTLLTLFLVMAMVGVASAGGYYLMEALRRGLNSRPVFIMFTLAAPTVVVVIVSLAYMIYRSVMGLDDEEGS